LIYQVSGNRLRGVSRRRAAGVDENLTEIPLYVGPLVDCFELENKICNKGKRCLTLIIPFLFRDASEKAFGNLLPTKVLAVKLGNFTVLSTEDTSSSKESRYGSSKESQRMHGVCSYII
jgi:hypothetical protein